MIQVFGNVFLETFLAFLGVFYLLWEGLKRLVVQILGVKFRYRETLDQLYEVGVRSTSIVVFSMVFISLMLLSEFTYHMNLVLRQNALVPPFSTLMMIRELGSVVTCFLLSAKVGAAISAEVGLMKISEQLDALELMSVDVVDYLLVPRWVGTVCAAVFLYVIAVGFSTALSVVFSPLLVGPSSGEFIQTMFSFAEFSDILKGIVKSAVFGTLIAMCSLYHGFTCQPGSRGVGNAAAIAVVRSSILIIIADFILTYAFYS